ncbi:molybdenum cofactor guanylyltransferase MobA [Avibacterium sp. 21-595]|uniref:molybdenum cofactor guanylyltransferase MobA n=1 Tax=unclassified Avibacterium TaxID=2685287 RepID=UPI002027011A|nr:molybdenum cofactor guanylyltransferase MobA [Avibacterium sp. 21-595]URL02209.1 molybdenum cofactor guanylyltransferase MobA [Avibacterium sp. 20-126]URL06846.1 molybdenum cofactor guanylyltransferase MobA [Avibacterium sp. 21-595]
MKISAVILAGGLARRMGGADKGLQLLQGQPLFWHCYQRLTPQLNDIAINANRNQALYRQSGLPVFADELADFQGPLSGILTSLRLSHSDFVLFVPCDCPFLPLNLLEKLQQPILRSLPHSRSAGENSPVLLTYATDGEREHPTFCLVSTTLAEKLADYLQKGERRMLQFMRQNGAIAVDFSEQKAAFQNFNTLADLESKVR